VRDVETVDLELMAADATTLQNKLVAAGKEGQVQRQRCHPRENEHCQKINAAIQQGIPARRQKLTAPELASVFECNSFPETGALHRQHQNHGRSR